MDNPNSGKWVDWPTNPSSIWEVPKIDWIIAVLPGTKKNDGRPYPYIKSWAHPVKALRYLLKKSCNLRVSLMFSL